MATDIYSKIAGKIINEQALVIGPLAWSEARKVKGISVGSASDGITVEPGKPTAVIDSLVARYEHLFGRASQEVCKEAASSIIASMSRENVPTSLLT